MVPLWSSYLVRVYSWKLILAKEGILNWLLELFHLDWLLYFSFFCRRSEVYDRKCRKWIFTKLFQLFWLTANLSIQFGPLKPWNLFLTIFWFSYMFLIIY